MLGTRKTYDEFLRDVRAKQFGWDLAEPTPLDDTVAKPVTSNTDKTTDDKQEKAKPKSKKSKEKE